jgi:hypothetical protein
MVTITFLLFFPGFIFGFAKMDIYKCPKSKNQKTFAKKLSKKYFNIYYCFFYLKKICKCVNM